MRTWITSTAGGLPKMYWFLWTGMLINRLGGFVALFLSLVRIYQREYRPGGPPRTQDVTEPEKDELLQNAP